MAVEQRALPPAAAGLRPPGRAAPSPPPRRLREHAAAIGPAGAAFAFVTALATNDGGYFPTAWGWATIALAWVAGVALVIRPDARLGLLERVFLTALALLTAWIALSTGWSSDVDGSVLEAQRALLYLTGALAAVLVLRRAALAPVLAGLLAGIAWTCAQGLATRVVPSLQSGVQEISPGRLAEPVGYWNALGLVAVIGALLALAFAAHGRGIAARAAAAAVLPLVLTTAYFTYSRGAVLALAVGLLAALVFDGRRLTMLLTALALSAPSAVAVWLAARAPALNSTTAAHADVVHQGRTLALALVALMAASSALAVGACAYGPRLRRRLRARRRARRALAAAACVALALAGGAVQMHGGPGYVARSALDAFRAAAPASEAQSGTLDGRLATIANGARVEQWRVALRERAQHPWLGSGAGTFEQSWLRERSVNDTVRDAHSLYLEGLAELGPLGLLLILVALLVPLAGGLRARTRPLLAGAFGTYAAFVVHAGLDWDWEMPIVTLLALCCGASLLTAGHRGGDAGSARRGVEIPWRALGLAAVVVAVALSAAAIAGNQALARAGREIDAGDAAAARTDAASALRWAPWSATARELLGRAEVGLGAVRPGRANLRAAAVRSPASWRIWYELGLAASGSERRLALARAATLNPVGDDIVALREQGLLPARTVTAR